MRRSLLSPSYENAIHLRSHFHRWQIGHSGIPRHPHPELLLAGAYAACFHGALANAARNLGTPVLDSRVRALVSLIEDETGAYSLDVKLHANLPGIDADQAMRIMEAAHQTCPYSKMMRGEARVSLIVD